MSVSRRTRLSVIAAAASGALVVAMAAGAALAVDPAGPVDCAGPDLCGAAPVRPAAVATGETPSTTPAAALERDPDDPGKREAADGEARP
jgi:hypothetical protein